MRVTSSEKMAVGCAAARLASERAMFRPPRKEARTMTDCPMIFSAPMVQALLDGRKTQTRRILGNTYRRVQPGDRLWVKEAIRFDAEWDGCKPSEFTAADAVRYEADGKVDAGLWGDPFTPGRYRHARFMPRWASRLTLPVSEVRAQRVRDISEADAMAEGVESGQTSRGLMWKAYGEEPNCWVDTPRMSFIRLWNTLHGPDAWDRNDWVAADTFTVQRGNIDQVKS